MKFEAGVVRPDIVFTRRRIAVFVDGCFWHSCPEHGSSPRVNTSYWGPKLERNAQRDVQNNQILEDKGWLVIRVWEHEGAREAVERIEAALRTRA